MLARASGSSRSAETSSCADWNEIVLERKDATLDGFNIVGDMLSLDYLKDVQSHVEVHDLDGKLVRELTLPTVGSGSVIYGNPDEPSEWTLIGQ